MAKGSGKCDTRMNILLDNYFSENISDYQLLNQYINLEQFLQDNNISSIISNQLIKEEVINYLKNKKFDNIVSHTLALYFINNLNNNNLLNDKQLLFTKVNLDDKFDKSLENNFAKPRAIFLNNSYLKDNLAYMQFLENKTVDNKYTAKVFIYIPYSIKENLTDKKLEEIKLEINNAIKEPLIIKEGKFITDDDLNNYLQTYCPTYYNFLISNKILNKYKKQIIDVNYIKKSYVFENQNQFLYQLTSEVSKNKEKEFLETLQINLLKKFGNKLDIKDNYLDIIDYQSVHDISGGKKYVTKLNYNNKEAIIEYVPYHINKKIETKVFDYKVKINLNDITLSQLEEKLDSRIQFYQNYTNTIIDANDNVYQITEDDKSIYYHKTSLSYHHAFDKLINNNQEIKQLLENFKKLEEKTYDLCDLINCNILPDKIAYFTKKLTKKDNKIILKTNDNKEYKIQVINNLEEHGFKKLKNNYFYYNSDEKIEELKKMIFSYQQLKEGINLNFKSRYNSNLNELSTKSDRRIFKKITNQYPILNLFHNELSDNLLSPEKLKKNFEIIVKQNNFTLNKECKKIEKNIEQNAVLSEKGHFTIKNLNSKESFNLLKDLGLADNYIDNVPYKIFYPNNEPFRKVTPKLNNYLEGSRKIRLPKGHKIVHGLTGVNSHHTALERLKQIENTGGLKSIAQRRKEQIKVHSMSPKGDIASGIDNSVPCKIAKEMGYGSFIFFGIKEEALERRDLFFSYTDFGAGKNRYPDYNNYAQSIGQGHIYNPPSHKARIKHLKNGLKEYNEIWFKDQVMLDELECIYVDWDIYDDSCEIVNNWKIKKIVDNNFKVIAFKDQYHLNQLLNKH